MVEFFLFSGVALLFFLAFVGLFLPILPTHLFILVAALMVHSILPEASNWVFLMMMSGLAVLAMVIDFACTYWGAKKFGASWVGALGALLGVFVGPFVFTPFLGLIIGPLVGAVLFEFLASQELKKASMAGLGTIVGGFIAFIFKFLIALVMMVWLVTKLVAYY